MLRGNYRKFVSAFFFNLIHCNFVIFYVVNVAGEKRGVSTSRIDENIKAFQCLAALFVSALCNIASTGLSSWY